MKLAPDASAESVRRRALDCLDERELVPTREEFEAIELLVCPYSPDSTPPKRCPALASRDAEQLRAEIISFRGQFFSIPVADRQSRWRELARRCEGRPQLIKALRDLAVGLPVEPRELQSLASPLARRLGALAMRLFTASGEQQSRLRSKQRAAVQGDLREWRSAASELRREAPEFAQLAPRLLEEIEQWQRRTRRQRRYAARLRWQMRLKGLVYDEKASWLYPALAMVVLIIGAIGTLGGRFGQDSPLAQTSSGSPGENRRPASRGGDVLSHAEFRSLMRSLRAQTGENANYASRRIHLRAGDIKSGDSLIDAQTAKAFGAASSGDLDAAVKHASDAFEHTLRLLDAAPSRLAYQRRFLFAAWHYADLLCEQVQYDRAARIYRRAIHKGNSAIAANGDDKQLHQAQAALANNLAVMLLDQREAKEAIRAFTGAIPHVEVLAKAAPSGAEAIQLRLRLFKNMALAYTASNGPAALIDEARRWRSMHPRNTALLGEIASELALAAKKTAATRLDPTASEWDKTKWRWRMEAAQRLAGESLRMFRETQTSWRSDLAALQADPRWEWVLKQPPPGKAAGQGSSLPRDP